MQRGHDIRALNLTNTPKEIFDYVGMLEKSMETLSGINSVSRGNPDPNLRSGNALALVQSMSLQFMSGLQQSYVGLIEDLGMGVINILKDYAATPRMAAIVGKTNRSYMREFTGDDLSSISRVSVEIANPLSRTTAGRLEMGEQLLQMGLIKSPQQYFSILNTGSLDVMTEDEQHQLFLIKAENEYLSEGKPQVAVFIDDHDLHIKEHGSVLSDPEMRQRPEIVAAVLAHIQEHMDLLRGTKMTPAGVPMADPAYLQIVGQQPLGPVAGSPPNMQQQQVPANSMQQEQAIPEMMNPALSQDPMNMMPQNLPSPAQPPMVNGQPQPATPEQMAMMSQGGVPVGT